MDRGKKLTTGLDTSRVEVTEVYFFLLPLSHSLIIVVAAIQVSYTYSWNHLARLCCSFLSQMLLGNIKVEPRLFLPK